MHRLTRLVLGTAFLLCPSLSLADAIVGAPTHVAGFVGQSEFGPLDQPTLVTSTADFLATFGSSAAGLSNPYLAPSVAGFFANGGQRCYVVRVTDADDASFVGFDGGPGDRTGLQALRDVEEVSMVAVPGAASLAVQTAMIALCESEGDRMAILDPASTDDVVAVLDQRGGLASAEGFAALYFPWIVAAPLGVSSTLPPSGFVAGVYARTEAHDSPVGAVATATTVSLEVSAAQQDELNVAGVDVIRFFAGQGVLVFGARTVSSDSEWKYVPVRRTALFLEKSIHEGTQWAVFEPNDPTLWDALRTCIEDFLYQLFQAGWFQGATSDDAYFVRVDQTTMTPTDIEEGRTVILVGFAPLRPAEFVLLRIVHERSSGTAVTPRPVRLDFPPPAPNPFNPRTTIRFELGTPALVSLNVYDAVGRKVRALRKASPLEAGVHEVPWQGDDDRGRPVASGVYTCRITAGSSTAVQRMTLVR